MKRLALFFLMFLFSCMNIYSQSTELTKIFDDANKLYLEQKYEAAINQYESILKNGYENGELHFNLGNAYFKLGKIQNAIINYERAKKFNPNDEDIQFNLQLANVQILDKIDAIPELFVYHWIDSALTLFSLKTIIWLMYALFMSVLISFSYFLFAQSYVQKRVSLMSGIVFSFFLVVGIFNFLIQSYRESNTEYAVVMSDVANIKSAPDSKGNDLFVIHRGLKIQVLDNVNKWHKIKLVDGKVGWIPQGQIEII